jgi:sugar/nucleoside kinase (ribokinase family)
MRLVSLGDLLVDVVVALDATLDPGDDATATTRMGAGGQAANVAAWAAALGAEASFVGKRGEDAAAAMLTSELESRGVRVVGPREGRTGIVVSLSGEGDRSMASDRGSAPELRADELDPAWFSGDHLHVSGYALAREPIASAALRGAALARAGGAEVSLDLSAASLIELAPALVFATERECERFGELEARVLVKRGAAGVSLDGADYPAAPTELLDTTGAGDALAAGYLVGGISLALEAAARCCARLGSMP